MGKGQRNRGDREIELGESSKKQKLAKAKRKKPMPKWLKNTIAIAVAVVLVLGIVALVMLSNGTFRRMQVLVKSTTGEFDVNRQMATFIAWEIEYYSAYVEYEYAAIYDQSSDLLTKYSSPELYALNYATARVTDDIETEDTVLSTPRDAIDNTVAYMINFVAVCDYVYENRPDITLTEDEWKGDFKITWLSGAEDDLPVTWADLADLQEEYGFSSLDRFLDEFFGHGFNSDDVEDSLKLICLYEKYMAIYKEEVENGTTNDNIVQYVKDHPEYFYTTDYFLYNTESEELKQALIRATTDEEFRTIIANDWFNTQGNYKDIYNEQVTLKKAEDNLAAIKDTTNENGGTGWTDALDGIGATYHEYKLADRENTEVIEADVSKWLFDSSRAQYDDTLIVTDKGFYVLSFSHAVYENNEKVAVAVYEKIYEHADGTTYEEDAAFKDNMWKHLLSKLELTEEKAPTVSYKTALEKSQALEESWAELDAAGKLEEIKKLSGYRYTTECTINNDAIPAVILDALFDGEKAPEAGWLFSVKESDILAYIVFVESVNSVSDDDEVGTMLTIHYADFAGDKFYTVLDELLDEIDDVMPEEKSEYYTATPAAGTYFEWMFKGATLNSDDMSFTLNGATGTNSVKEFYSEKANSDGTTTASYAIYFVTDAIHLDTEMLVNGGYFAYVGSDAQKVYDEQLAGKTGDELITALQKIGVVDANATNNATVSENMDRETVAEEDEALAKWLFDDEKDANAVKLLDGKNGKKYFAVYFGEAETWKAIGKVYYVTDTINQWMTARKSAYEVNDWVLGLYGDPTPTTTTTTTAAQ